MKKVYLGVFILSFIVLLFSCESDTTNEIQQDFESATETIIPGEYIVVLQSSTSRSIEGKTYQERVQNMKMEAHQIMNQIGVDQNKVKQAYGTAINGFSVSLTDEELFLLEKDLNVSKVYPDKLFTLGNGPGGGGGTIDPLPDPDQTIPYGITRVGYGDGTGKTAWILDTGVDMDHADLNVDQTRGYDFINNDTFPDDDNGHGSHCAGTVAAINNDIGVVGVAANATIVPVKVLDRRGSGAYSVIIAGIDYVAANASPGDAVNMSLGGGVYELIDEAVFAASENGIFFALAAGNESDDANNHSPARVNGQYIWTISAMDDVDYFAYFSNYGNPPIDYCMPGVNVYSTFKSGGYETYSGTSMAAPHMCGVLLMTGGSPSTDGFVNGDPDGNPDPIGHL